MKKINFPYLKNPKSLLRKYTELKSTKYEPTSAENYEVVSGNKKEAGQSSGKAPASYAQGPRFHSQHWGSGGGGEGGGFSHCLWMSHLLQISDQNYFF